jgi:hypothetical protein
MWPGDTADVTSLIPVVDRLRRRFAIGRVCVVADRGNARTTLHYGEEQFPVELTIDTRGEAAGFIDFAHDGGGRYRSARQPPAHRFHLIRQIKSRLLQLKRGSHILDRSADWT